MTGWRSLLAGKPLTARELEILDCVAEGFSNRDIGDMLVISERTVRTHCSTIIAKLGAHNRTDATRIARETGLLDGVVRVPEPRPRYAHRDGDPEPPECTGYFWMENMDGSERTLILIEHAPWDEWKMRRFGGKWERYQRSKLRAAGMRFWGPVLPPDAWNSIEG